MEKAKHWYYDSEKEWKVYVKEYWNSRPIVRYSEYIMDDSDL